MASQVVAVEYSGCELHIIEACRVAGNYAWTPTTVATDTVEIHDADDLYAKLPLGAVSLEGELQRSGRLAVRTTVGGQMRVAQIDTAQIPREGACERATHVVSAVAIGTFKLLSGGALKVEGQGSVAGVGAAGGSHGREEEIVREAGDPRMCNEAAPDKPHGACASPIQLFLRPIQRAMTVEEKKNADAEKEAQQKGGVKIQFGSPNLDERWSLRNRDGGMLCSLPCTHWVGAGSGYYVQKDEARTSGVTRVEVPDEFAFASGTTLEAAPKPGRGSIPLSIGAMAVSAVALGTGIALTGDGAGSNWQNPPGQEHYGAESPALDGTLLAVGGVGLVASTLWFLWSRGTYMAVKPSGDVARIHVKPDPSVLSGTF